MKERIKNRLKDLAGLHGISGYEQPVVKYMRDALKPLADEVHIDSMGNVVAVKYGKKPGPKVMVVSHSDEIGFQVKSILSNGFLLFNKVGTASDKVMEGRSVLIKGTIPGVIGIKPGHLQSPQEATTVKTARDCYIDVGACSDMEVKEMGISIGDPIVFDSPFTVMGNGDIVRSKAIDNRIGCGVIVELFEELKDGDFPGTLYGVSTVQEETGMKGAFVTGNRLGSDIAFVIDTIPSGDTPDVNFYKELPVALGKGPVCVLADGVVWGLLYTFAHRGVTDFVEQKARECEIPLQVTTLMGESYATDAARLSFSGKGIPCATLALPRRYSHSPVEVMNLNDAVATLELLKKVICDSDKISTSFLEEE